MRDFTDTHQLGTKANILLSSVFGPYAQDDEYGSRKCNPMELYHNQVTRVQGAYSLRMFHRSFGLKLIQENLEAPCTLLDFPTLDRFEEELKNNSYDIVGISAIIPNVYKVKKMCELIRCYHPSAKIIVGGHVANMDNLKEIADIDYVVKGEGVKWFRRYLGQKENQKIKHPSMLAAFGAKIVGVPLSNKEEDTSAVLIPSVGCPMGCNFCSTSSLFGGKGNFVNFFETGDELFQTMCKIENDLNNRAFFILDENFLLYKKRALRLLELMEKNNKSWSFSIFSSAKIIQSYSIDQLVSLGVTWIWVGLEGKNSQYEKLSNIDLHQLIKQLQENGIRVLGSTILGLENHTPENIYEAIDYAVSFNTDFHQFMLYTPIPGTPLYKEYQKDDKLLSHEDFSYPDTHGQYRFNFKHKYIKDFQEEKIIIDAFSQDFRINGPSLLRLIRTMLAGWKKHKNNPKERVREKFNHDAKSLKSTYAGAIYSMKKWYKNDKQILAQIQTLLNELYTAN